MCDPITLTGLALTAGSTVANTMAQAKVDKARNQAMAAERIRQGALNSEAAALNDASRAQYGDFGTDQAAKADGIETFFNDLGADPAAADLPQSGSNIVVDEIAKQKGKADAFGNQQDEALASLRSFGDLLGDYGRTDARNAAQVGMLAGFKKGSAGILPLELDQAQTKGQQFRLLGDILGGAGSLAVGKGLQGSMVTPAATAANTLVKPLVPAYSGGPSVSLYPRTQMLR